MSGYLAGQVWNSALDSALKPTAACLADFANDEGQGIHPSIEYLVWRMGVGESTIKRHMAQLREMEIIEAIANEKGGRGKIPVYRMNEDRLPKRPSWREFRGIERVSIKGGENEMLSVKGLISEEKGLISDIRNKEESLDKSNRQFSLSPPSSESGNGKSHKTKKEADPRFREFLDVLSRFHHHLKENKQVALGEFVWTGADGSQLKQFLARNPSLVKKEFGDWLNNYQHSEKVNLLKRPAQFLVRLHEYAEGPLNEFGRPLEESRV